MEPKTIVSISINNQNKITSFYDLSGIENEEQGLRMVHSILDELKFVLLNKISSITEQKTNPDTEQEFEL
jgi:hypothetical protein